MIRAQCHDPAAGQTVFGGEEVLDRWRGTPGAVVWVDLHEVDREKERRLLAGFFGMHPAAIDDAQAERHPPKLEEFEDHLLLLLKGLDAETEDIDFGTIQIAMFLGERFLVTRHSGVSPSVDRLWRSTEESPDRLSAGPDRMALDLIQIIMDRFLPILLAVELRLDTLEREVVEEPRDELLAELMRLKLNLTRMRRITTYHTQIFSAMAAAPSRRFRPALRHDLRDVYEKLDRALTLTSLYYDLAEDLMNGYLSIASHRLNNIMRVLTIVASIFIPLTFLAGIYGMNFENIPELHYRHSYFVLLGVMVAIAGALVLLFRRSRWL